jgi:hypothetical protein
MVKVVKLEKLKFYDVKGKKKFTSDKYKYVTKKTKRGPVRFAVTKAPSGIESWRIVSRK